MIKYGDREKWACTICGEEVETSTVGLPADEIVKIATVVEGHVHDMIKISGHEGEDRAREADDGA